MSSFSCPHIDLAESRCLRLRADCVPGRPGCVLGTKVRFAFPLEERLANHRKSKMLLQQAGDRAASQLRTPNR